MNIFEVAREKQIQRVLVPSSIATFAPIIPKTMASQKTILPPTSYVRVIKFVTELLGTYYKLKYSIDGTVSREEWG